MSQPASLSPSRAADFKQCPLLYRFRVIDRLPEPPSAAAARGTLVHSVLERLFDLPPGERSLPAAIDLLAPAWAEMLAAEPELAALIDGDADADWLAAAHPLLEAYFAMEDPRQLTPADRELHVTALVGDGEQLQLRGYVDRLDAAADGRLRVVDYKTGRAPKAGYEAKAMFQMRFYALAIWRDRGVVPTLLQLMYLGSQEVLRYEPDEADLRATERQVLALAAAIRRAQETQDFRPNPSRLCDWCSHQELCPQFGGTPPPYPPPAPVAVEAVEDDEVPSPFMPVDEV